MGKKVQIKSDFSSVLLPSGVFDAGETTVLTDAEYAALDAATLRAVTLLTTTTEPTRTTPVAIPVVSGLISRKVVPLRAFQGLKRNLELGRTVGVGLLGDSTGNDTTEWFYMLGQSLAAMYPVYTVQSRLWNDTTQQFDPPVTIQTGPGGAQYLDCVADAAKNTLLTKGKHPASGNLDIRIKLASTNWGSNPALANLASRSGVSGQYSHWINYTTGRTIQFVYSTTGANTLTATSTAAVPFTNSQVGWVRVVAIGNNGTQAEFRFYTSTDGVTWTQLGATVNATTYTLYDGGYSFEFGGRGVLNFPGSIYETEFRDGENGPLMAPSLPGLYGPNPLSTPDATVKGAPVLTLVNGSRPGADITYLGDSTRLPKMTPDYGQVLTFTSDSHNETTTGLDWLTLYRNWLTSIAARQRGPLVAVTQNPQAPTNTGAGAHLTRRLELLSLVDERSVIDTYQLFLDYGSTYYPDLMVDTVHPNSTGSTMWRDLVLAHFNAA